MAKKGQKAIDIKPPLVYIDDINSCINDFNKKTYYCFRNLYSDANIASIKSSEISLYNNEILTKGINTQVERIVVNCLLFLLPSPLLPVDQIFDLLHKLSLQGKNNSNTKKAIKYTQKIIADNSNSLNQFAAMFGKMKASWIHFLVFGQLINKVNSSELKKTIVSSFVSIAEQLDVRKASDMSTFISSIPQNLFFQYVRPFLDSRTLRNAKNIVHLLPYFITPLKFSIFSLTKASISNFIETLSGLCESHDEKLAKECFAVLRQIAPCISPKCVKINSMSAIALFSSIIPSKSGLQVALEQLNNKQINISARHSIKMYLIKLASNDELKSFFDFDSFVQNYIIAENDYIALYFAIDYIKDTSAITSYLMEKDGILPKIILFKMGCYSIKETDLANVFSSSSCNSMKSSDIIIYTNLLYDIKDMYPDLVTRSFTSLLSFSNYRDIILSCIKKCISQGENLKIINGIINAFKIIKPTEMLQFDFPLNILEELKTQQKIIALAAGYPIKSIDSDTIKGLFEIPDKEWQRGINEVIFKITCKKEFHSQIVTEVMKRRDKWNLNYAYIIAKIFKSFNRETDSELVKEIFHCNLTNVPLQFVRRIVSLMPWYRKKVDLFIEVFKSLSDLKKQKRENIYTLFPQRNFGEFDFILLYPTIKYLMSQRDNISDKLSTIIAKFSYIDFKKRSLYDVMVSNGNEESIAKFFVSDKLNEISDSEIAYEVSQSRRIAEIVYKLIENEKEGFDKSLTSCVLTLYDLYSSCLPDFREYLHNMVGFNLDHEISTSEAIAKAIINCSKYVKEFSSNIKTIINDSVSFTRYAVEILSNINNYHAMANDVANFMFSLKLQDFDPVYFNKVFVGKLATTLSDMTIDFFFSKPNFVHVKSETFETLENALTSSNRKINSLIKMIENYSDGDISDNTIIELLRCFDILYFLDIKNVSKHANLIIKNVASERASVVALNFHYSNVPYKDLTLRHLMTDEDNKKGLEVFKYIFLNPLEKENAKQLIQDLFEYCDNASDDVMQSANGTLISAASFLDKKTLNSIIPSEIALITPDLSRRSEIALYNVFLTTGKRFPDILIDHLNLFILCLLSGNMRDDVMMPFLNFIETILKENESSPLLKMIFIELKKSSKPIEILNLILKNLNYVNESQKTCLTIFQMIQNYLVSSDQNVKLLCFSVLAKLDLPDENIDQAVDIFISIMNGTIRQQIVPYFREFINKISYDKKIHVYNKLVKVGKKLTVQSNGFSLLFACIISELNSQEKIDEMFYAIRERENGFYVDSLLASIEEIYEISNIFFVKSENIIACIFEQVSNNPSLVERLIKNILKYLDNTQIRILAKLINDYLSHDKAQVREVCVNLLIAMIKMNLFTPKIVQINIYKRIAEAIRILRNDPLLKTMDLLKIQSKLDPEAAKFVSSEYNFKDFIGRFIRVNELCLVSILRLADIFNEVNELPFIISIMYNWSKEENFENQYIQLITRPKITRKGFNATVNAINQLNDVDRFDNPFLIPDNYVPRISLNISTINIITEKLLDMEGNADSSDIIDGINLVYPFFLAFYRIIKANERDRNNPIINTFERISQLLHFPFIKSVSRTSSDKERRMKIIPRSISTYSINKGQNIEKSLKKAVIREFISVGTLYSALDSTGRSITGFPIGEKAVLDLLLSISEKNPIFFLARNITFKFFYGLFSLLFSSHCTQLDKSTEIVENIIARMPTNQSLIKFINLMTSFFKFYKSNRISLLPKNIGSKLMERFIECGDEYLNDEAEFFIAAFPFLKEKDKSTYGLEIVRLMLSAQVDDPQFYNFCDIFISISLFLPYIEGQTCHIATLMAILNIITQTVYSEGDDLRCTFLTVIGAVLSSSSANPQFILQIMMERLNRESYSAFILEGISHALSLPAISLSPEFLKILWMKTKKYLERGYNTMKFFTAKIGANIINSCCDFSDEICSTILLGNKLDLKTKSIFVASLNNYDCLNKDMLMGAKKYIGDRNNAITLIPLVNAMVKTEAISKKERLAFLVRGLQYGFATPMMCYTELRKLIPDIRSLSDSDTFIVTGIYIAASECTHPQLKKYANDTLKLILTKELPDVESSKVFNERYFNNIGNQHVKQALEDIINYF